MNQNIEIVGASIDKDTLHVTVKIEKRIFASEPRIKIFDSDVIEALKDQYDILSVISSNVISNSQRGGMVQQGTWSFKIKQKTQRKRTASKPKTQPVSEENKDKTENIDTKPRKKSSTTRNIRGRMSKIAKSKTNNQ